MPPELVVPDEPVKEAIKPMFGKQVGLVLYEFERFDPVVEMLRASDRGGPKVLECLYGTEKSGWAAYYFWPGVPPGNIEMLLAADKKGKLRYLGTK